MATQTDEDPNVFYALDFDGVLVDSAGETAQSGLRGAKLLWPSASWTQPQDMDNLLQRFRSVRPVLYVGWESILIVKLLLDPEEGFPSNEDIFAKFHSEYKQQLMKKSGFEEDTFSKAMKDARDTWIEENNGQDWIDAHGFFEGACMAVKEYMTKKGNDRVYVITTKAKSFAERLLQQRGLYQTTTNSNDGSNRTMILESHIHGLGSGPKAEVLQKILEERNSDIAVMVEDNIDTLDNIMESPVQDKVLPVVASWGYNTEEHLLKAKEKGYIMLNYSNPHSIHTIFWDDQARKLHEEFVSHKR